MSSRPTVLLADDHALVAEGLASLLKDDYTLVGIVNDGASLIEAARRLVPDVIVTDVSMPGITGIEAARILHDEGLPSRIIVLTMHGDPEIAREAFRAGAVGFLKKHAAGDELLLAIEQVVSGNSYLTPMVTRDVMTAFKTSGGLADAPARDRRITPRQEQVLRLIAAGKRMKEIAATLGLSARTVESHKYDMMQALGLGSTAELVQYAIRHGFITNVPAANNLDRTP
jgi:DNA-binding NarL/FixJ family response regulator